MKSAIQKQPSININIPGSTNEKLDVILDKELNPPKGRVTDSMLNFCFGLYEIVEDLKFFTNPPAEFIELVKSYKRAN